MYSAALCRGLIEAAAWPLRRRHRAAYSAALCRGLIEAARSGSLSAERIPRYSAALCRGLIEALMLPTGVDLFPRSYSAALCRGLIEARATVRIVGVFQHRIPRLYAAASLKQRARHLPGGARGRIPRLYAAASLKHLRRDRPVPRGRRRIPRLYAAASLKHRRRGPRGGGGDALYSASLCRGLIEATTRRCSSPSTTSVFRGFMPRPH